MRTIIPILSIALLFACSTPQGTAYRPAPLPPDTAKTVVKEEPKPIQPPAKQKRDMKISLLAPLNITYGDEYQMDPSIADYYEGILMGLDSLKKCGYNIKLDIYDTKSDTALIRKITWKKELAESDLIIGPMFKAGYAMISKYATARKIAVVSPFSNANMWSDSSQYSIYCNPDDKSYARAFATFVKSRYGDTANLLLLNDGSKEDKDFIWRFKVAAKEMGLTKWKDITYDKGWGAVSDHLRNAEHGENILIVPTDNEKYAVQLLTLLKSEDQSNTLLALPEWLDFSYLDYQSYQLWEKNKLHILTPFYINPADTAVIEFKAAYKEKYKAIPGDFVYRGYDHILVFAHAFFDEGKDSDAWPTDKEYKGLHTHFMFRFNDRAIENQWVNLLRFQNYRFVPVNLTNSVH